MGSRGQLFVWVALSGLCGCVHRSATSPATPQATPLPFKSTADLAFEQAAQALSEANYSEARRLFAAFAQAFPSDPRRPLARIQEAFADLIDPDLLAGLDRAQTVLATLAPNEGDPLAVSQLEALLLARAQALQGLASMSELLAECQGQASELLDRQKANSRATVGKLQQELQRRDETLEQVKQRLLEIQQLAADMLGAPRAAGAPNPAPPASAPASPHLPQR